MQSSNNIQFRGLRDETDYQAICAVRQASVEWDKIDVLSGDDFLTFPMMACGAKGVISVSANAIPDRVKAMVKAALEGDFVAARQMHLDLLAFHNAMFIESNPVPVKTTLELMGKMSARVRLPLVAMSDATLNQLQAILKTYKVI